MGRIFFFVLIAAVLYFGWRTWRTKQVQQSESTQSPSPSGKLQGHKMVKCDHCGVYLAENEAIEHGGHYYCCKQHMIKGPTDNEN